MRAAVLVLGILFFVPLGQVLAEIETVDSEPLVSKDVMQSYSRTVQIAFDRVSDIESYDKEVLAEVDSWLVVTGIDIGEHHKTVAKPDETAPVEVLKGCLLYTSPSPRDGLLSRMPSSA